MRLPVQACSCRASGADHVLALRNDGVVLSWGVGMVGQLGRVGTRMLDPEAVQLTPGTIPFTRNRAKAAHITDIATGSYSSFAVTAKGNVFAWGLNNYGQLGVSSKVHWCPQLHDVSFQMHTLCSFACNVLLQSCAHLLHGHAGSLQYSCSMSWSGQRLDKVEVLSLQAEPMYCLNAEAFNDASLCGEAEQQGCG